MKRIILNPTLFTSEKNAQQDRYRICFNALWKDFGDVNDHYLLKGIHTIEFEDEKITIEIELTHSLLKRKRKNTKGIEGVRYEVLDNAIFYRGNQSTLAESLGVLNPKENFVFKKALPGKRRVCKIVDKYSSAIREANFLLMNEEFHVKPVPFSQAHGFIVMRLLKAYDLGIFISACANSLTLQDAIECTHAIIKAVKEQVYDKGIIHCDLKPSNMLIENTNHGYKVTIIDYGMANRRQEDKDFPYINYGYTEGFQPPEINDQEKPLFGDLYSLGKTLAVFWDYKPDTAPISNGLFVSMEMSPDLKSGLITLFNGLLKQTPSDRMSLEQALELTDSFRRMTFNKTELGVKNDVTQLKQEHPSPKEPPIRIIINPTRFTEEETNIKSAFKTLLTLDACKDLNLIRRGVYPYVNNGQIQQLCLSHSILKRKKSGNTEHFRFEVLEHDNFSDNSSTSIVNVIGTLIPEKNYSYKIKSEEKSRVCVSIPFQKDVSEQKLEPQIATEASYLLINKRLHAKPPVFTENSGLIVMRRFTGDTLRDFLNSIQKNQKDLDLKSRLKITYEIVKALKEQVQDINLIHFDFTPENIRITFKETDIHVDIINYGLAVNKTEKLTRCCGLGDPAYTAPEIWESSTVELEEPAYTAPEIWESSTVELEVNDYINADVYSLGLVLRELWGDNFRGKSLLELATFHTKNEAYSPLGQEIEIPEYLELNLNRIFKGFLKKDPVKRMSIDEGLFRLERLIKLQDNSELPKKYRKMPLYSDPDDLITLNITLNPTEFLDPSLCQQNADKRERLSTIIDLLLQIEGGGNINKGVYTYDAIDFISSKINDSIKFALLRCVDDFYMGDVPQMVVSLKLTHSLVKREKANGSCCYEVWEESSAALDERGSIGQCLGELIPENQFTFTPRETNVLAPQSSKSLHELVFSNSLINNKKQKMNGEDEDEYSYSP